MTLWQRSFRPFARPVSGGACSLLALRRTVRLPQPRLRLDPPAGCAWSHSPWHPNRASPNRLPPRPWTCSRCASASRCHHPPHASAVSAPRCAQHTLSLLDDTALTLGTAPQLTPRAGWVRYGLARPESVADHTFRMVRACVCRSLCGLPTSDPLAPLYRCSHTALRPSPWLSQTMMAFVASSLPGFDSAKAVKMALVHDLAESLVGDITPHDGVTKADKHAREEAAMTRLQLTLQGDVPPSAGGVGSVWQGAGDEMLALWHEYEACASPEALLLKDLDKLEMILQAHEYEQATGAPLDEFFRSTANAFLTPAGTALADEVRARRAKLAAEQADSGAAVAMRAAAAIGDDLADLGNLGDGFGA